MKKSHPIFIYFVFWLYSTKGSHISERQLLRLRHDVHKTVPPGSIGTISGPVSLVKFDGSPSETLKQIELPVIQFRRIFCQSLSPFLTSDVASQTNTINFCDLIGHRMPAIGSKNNKETQIRPGTTSKSCFVDHVPKNGVITMVNLTDIVAVGTEVENLVVIQYVCDSTYRLTGNEVNVCKNGIWSSASPICEPQSSTSNANCSEAQPPSNGFGFPYKNNIEYTYFFGCHPNFQLPTYLNLPINSINKSTCLTGNWHPEIPRACLPKPGLWPTTTNKPPPSPTGSCNILLGTTFKTVNCHLNGTAQNCFKPLPVGSKLSSICRPAYNTRKPSEHTCQSNGEWFPPPIRCNEICGKTSSPTSLPWGVMFTYDGHLDGVATIVSDRIVVAYGREAEEDRLKSSSTSLNKNSVGLWIYSPFDGYQPYHEVIKRVVIFRPSDSREGTFALYVTKIPFRFKLNRVSPICLDYTLEVGSTNVSAIGNTGIVATYRIKKLKFDIFTYTIVNNSQCVSEEADTNKYLEKQVEPDYFCVHQLSGVDAHNCSVLRDSELVFPKIENEKNVLAISEKNVFYLRGIPIGGHWHDHKCNWNDFQMFINIKYFLTEIKKYIEEYQQI